MPRASPPERTSRQITPLSVMAAASEPASGEVSPKQGTSRPSASRGSQYARCASVPNCISNSPGPSEFGTMMVTAPTIERVETLRTTSECAKAEKPRPPYSAGMIMPKNFSRLMKRQTSGGRSHHSQLIRQSSSMAQSSSVGPRRKASSASDSRAGGVSSRIFQSGLPANNSASHHTSPASSASRSVSDISGSALRAQRNIGRDKLFRRHVAISIGSFSVGGGRGGEPARPAARGCKLWQDCRRRAKLTAITTVQIPMPCSSPSSMS